MQSTLYEPKEPTASLPMAFVMRRLQSFSGFFLVLFLFEHLLTNSQAALFFGEDGKGFVEAVNFIYDLPFLPVLEILLLGVPIAVHGIWGIQYLYTAKFNSGSTDGATPSIKLPRNRAYTWQRITSILLVVGIILHVLFMRFINRPDIIGHGGQEQFTATITKDPGLENLTKRLGVKLVDATPASHLKPNEVVVISHSFGTAVLMVVRDTFKSVWLCILYSFFVTAACFHACNGLWTFTISWGITLTERSRRLVRYLANAILYLLLFLGLAGIWGTYWINLKG